MERSAANDLYYSSISVFHIQFRSVNSRRNHSIGKQITMVKPRIGVELYRQYREVI
jgi:hypothetical protein